VSRGRAVVRQGRTVAHYKKAVWGPMVSAGLLVETSSGTLEYPWAQREEIAHYNRFITTATHFRNIRPRRAVKK